MMMAGTSVPPRYKRLQNLFNVPHRESAGIVVEYELPGWAFGDFTRTGKPGVWNISKLMQTGGSLASSSFIVVVLTSSLHVTRELYRFAALSCPMIVTRDYGYIGRTSFSTVVEYKHKGSGSLLTRFESQFVRIDPETRRPIPLPEYISELTDRYPGKGTYVSVRPRPKDTTRYYTYVTKVAASDMDIQYHVTQSLYHKFCSDAAYEAGAAHFLQNFSRDICEYEVQHVVAKHAGEAQAGDEIHVLVWEDDLDKLMLHYEIINCGNDGSIFFSTVKYFALEFSV